MKRIQRSLAQVHLLCVGCDIERDRGMSAACLSRFFSLSSARRKSCVMFSKGADVVTQCHRRRLATAFDQRSQNTSGRNNLLRPKKWVAQVARCS